MVVTCGLPFFNQDLGKRPELLHLWQCLENVGQSNRDSGDPAHEAEDSVHTWHPPPTLWILWYHSNGIGQSWLNSPSDSKECWLRSVWSRSHLFWTGASCNQIYLQDLVVACCLYCGCHRHHIHQELRRYCYSSGPDTCGSWSAGHVWGL